MKVTLTVSREMFKEIFKNKPANDAAAREFIRKQWGIMHEISRIEWY